ncbi:hypothetical protein [Neogemmobacter tilapiae]|uniref:Uncharacterized protein n=1 Tax=Neogemmobacter tilapiae TaxID=875041 RepID=A0A918TMH5_9RHOB|nr:hypothetical protein [Gemmobacter tilapiae]GHC52571.1 hypothetical protein GCM10007315_13830 [Gemmobacter tilapiae]
MTSQPTPKRRRFLLWLGLTIAVMAVHFAAAIYFVTQSHAPETVWLDAGFIFRAAALITISTLICLLLVWYGAPLYVLILWKYLAAIEYLTGLPWGSRIGHSILRNASFSRAKPGTPYAWVYGLARRAYGDQVPQDKPNA